jgi:hypothetical protein
MGKGIVIALFCIIAFSPLSVMAGGNSTQSNASIGQEAYVIQWDTKIMQLKKADNIDLLISMSSYEAGGDVKVMKADSSQPSGSSPVTEGTYLPPLCDWCYEQTS